MREKSLVELGLLGEHPADDAVGGGGGGAAARSAERRALRERIERASRQQQRRRGGEQRERDQLRAHRQPWSGTFHRYLVGERRPVAVVRNFAGPPESPASRRAMSAVISCGLARLSWQPAGAFSRLTGSFSAKREIDEIARIEHFELERLGLHRRLQRQHEVQRQHRFLGIELEVYSSGSTKVDVLAVRLGVGEEVVLLQRLRR